MTAEPWLNTNIVRLKNAVLCANCEVITEGQNGHCSACGSEALLRLHELLGGTAEEQLNFEMNPILSERASGRVSFAA
jgi:hypothetical protein